MLLTRSLAAGAGRTCCVRPATAGSPPRRASPGLLFSAVLLGGLCQALCACTEASYQRRMSAAERALVGTYAVRSVRFAAGPGLLGPGSGPHFAYRELLLARVQASPNGLTIALTTCDWRIAAIGLGQLAEVSPGLVPERVLEMQIDDCEPGSPDCRFSTDTSERYAIGYRLAEAAGCDGHSGEEIQRESLPWSGAPETCRCVADASQPIGEDALTDCRVDDVDDDDRPGFSASIRETDYIHFFTYTARLAFEDGVIASDGRHRARDRREESFHALGCEPQGSCPTPDDEPCAWGTSRVDFVPFSVGAEPCRAIVERQSGLFEEEPRFPDQGCGDGRR